MSGIFLTSNLVSFRILFGGFLFWNKKAYCSKNEKNSATTLGKHFRNKKIHEIDFTGFLGAHFSDFRAIVICFCDCICTLLY